MFFRIVTESFRRQRRRKAIAAVAVTLGTAVAVALLNIALDVGDKINRELKAYGANLLIAHCDFRFATVYFRPEPSWWLGLTFCQWVAMMMALALAMQWWYDRRVICRAREAVAEAS